MCIELSLSIAVALETLQVELISLSLTVDIAVSRGEIPCQGKNPACPTPGNFFFFLNIYIFLNLFGCTGS